MSLHMIMIATECNEVRFVDKTKTLVICQIDTQYHDLEPRLEDSKFVYAIVEVIQYFQI